MIRPTQKCLDPGPMSRIGEIARESRSAFVRFLAPAQSKERLDGNDLPLLRERAGGEVGRMPIGESQGRRRIIA